MHVLKVLLIDHGVRRAAVCHLNMNDMDFARCLVQVQDKGGNTHRYHISGEALVAIQEYLNAERPQDDVKWQSPALFLAAGTNTKGDGRLSTVSINHIWNHVCETASAGRVQSRF